MYEITSKIQSYADACQVPPHIHSEDFIYKFLLDRSDAGENAAQHYFFNGAESCLKLKGLLETETDIMPDRPFDLLEFASGYGCVTRHFKNTMPNARVVASDIHPQAMDFVESHLAVRTALSNANPRGFDLGRQYDVVFALSFFTHMPDRTFGDWLSALFRHVRPGGNLIFTTHGMISLEKVWKNTYKLDPSGYLFVPVGEQRDIEAADYGTSMTSTDYVTRQIYRRLAAPTALISQGFWWGHQDVYVVAKLL